jgi:aminopeptidase N
MNATEQPAAIHLADYDPPAWQVDHTELRFEIAEGETIVQSRLDVHRGEQAAPLVLDGQELTLVEVAVDGRPLSSNEYGLDEDTLTLFDLPQRASVSVTTKIHPEQNTALEGLYKSSGMYCTQCEAEGFRKITYYPDRPDVLSTFTTTIVASDDYPVLLSNGNPIGDRVLPDGRREVTWSDPFPKPSYLFALVAGDLALLEDTFVTGSGRTITLRIYSEPHNIDQCDYAMDALKRSMRWDEKVYGREYDLDIFMIVAVDDFNMGAMENKGLNIFNTSCVLATPDTATDQAYQRVEAVVAHEYFHNWSGNRVTCRDWFQLSLKEGFTVFRDAEFSSDMNSRTVKRIEDVNLLRSVQFAEDAGPLAHPIRPASYIEISNFYTPTVYEKGAEVVRMVHTIVGPDDFRRGSDLYFDRYDGQAVTTEDFLGAMSDASGRDLTQFQRWYDQAGTPLLDVAAQFDDGILTLSITQSCPPTPGQSQKDALHIPVSLGLIDRAGDSLINGDLVWESDCEVDVRGDSLLIHLTQSTTQIRFPGLSAEPVISFLRGFSAPVKVAFDRPAPALAFLATRDSDGFAAWDALQSLLIEEIDRLPGADAVSSDVTSLFSDLLGTLLDGRQRSAEEQFLIAAKLAVPSENYLFEAVEKVDVDRLCGARDQLLDELSGTFADRWNEIFEIYDSTTPYAPTAEDMSRRAVRNTALAYLSRALPAETLSSLLESAYSRADNLTDRRAVLSCAVNADSAVAGRLLADFYQRWQAEALVVNQWFVVQSSSIQCSLSRLEHLVVHPAFKLTNPNKVRSVLSVFANQNQRNFHASDGSAYEYIADQVLRLNGINPQMAAALAKPLTRWRRYAGERSRLMQGVLQRIAASDDLSPDVFEVVTKSLD